MSAKGMDSQFGALYFARSYTIVHPFTPFQISSGLCVALDTGYCHRPLALYDIDFWQRSSVLLLSFAEYVSKEYAFIQMYAHLLVLQHWYCPPILHTLTPTPTVQLRLSPIPIFVNLFLCPYIDLVFSAVLLGHGWCYPAVSCFQGWRTEPLVS